MLLLVCLSWDTVRSQITAWAQPVLLVLGIITLVITLLTWRERRRTVNLQVARRARKVLRSLDKWLQHPALLTASTQPSANQVNQLANWVNYVVKGEDEVQKLLEEMLDTAGGAGWRVQRAMQKAYGEFVDGSDMVHNFGHAHITTQTTHMEQADAAKAKFAAVREALLRIIPKHLL